MTIPIAIDAMGGDCGPEVTVPAALAALEQHPELQIILVGQDEALRKSLSGAGRENSRLRLHPASQVVAMDESPALAMRNKKDSSMRVAIDLVKQNVAQACVSAGNTGALMATARFVLKTIPGISRPAIATSLPRPNGHVHMLDLGANVDSPPELLLQFGIMGSILVEQLENEPRPTIGLLNIGVEDIKGNDTIKDAAALFKGSDLNYVGFVEGDEIYTGSVDVIVCDGFAGNVALKASEGVAKMFAQIMREEFHRSPLKRFAGLVSLPAINALRNRVDPRRYNGASLVGLQGTVIKSHGSADKLAFQHAIEVALMEAQKEVPAKIQRGISAMTGHPA